MSGTLPDEDVSRGRSASSLPADLTSFEGRRADLGQVRQLLGETRLLTLVGFGGVGKTRLALKSARDLARSFGDGVAWVELADLRDPALLRQTVADAFNMTERPGRDTWQATLQYVATRRMLLVLDNCEHLLEHTAELVAELLRHAPGLRVLTTSRQILGVPGETVLSVAPLPVPPVEQAAEPGVAELYPSISLFRERAAAVVPGFELTPENQQLAAELCRKLEGIPLAIELAAVKLRVLSLSELVDRLDARLRVLRHGARTGPTRHRTIEATIDWSHELCTGDERTLWARASVFAGGFSIDAAEQVCAAEDLPRAGVLEVIEGLLEKSILTRIESDGQVRFRLLEPLREYGLERLRGADEYDEMLHRHVRWVEDLLDQACLQWFGPTQEMWCTVLRLELANIRKAAEHCLGHAPCQERTLVMLGEPWFLWIALFLDEGRQWLERTVAACPRPSPERARALATLGYVAGLQGDLARATEVTDQAAEMARSFGDAEVEAYAVHMAGLSALFHDPPVSVDRLSSALESYERHDVVDDLIVAARVQRGLAHLFAGDLVAARSDFDWCREICTLTGERWLLSYALYGQGFIEKLGGHTSDAIRLAREAVEIKWFFRDLCGLSTTMDLLAWAHADLGQFEDAAFLLGAADSLWTSFGMRLFGSDHWLENMRQAEEAAGNALGDRAFSELFTVGRELNRADAIARALGQQEVLPASPPRQAELVRLTRREEQIAGLVADGLSNRAIAERLVIAQRTAEGHVENILTKLGFRSRTQIAAWVSQRRSVNSG